MKKIYFLSILSLIILSGCDEEKPSESTVKNQVESNLHNCKIIHINNFHKDNGFLHPDGNYDVKVSFSFMVEPTDYFYSLQKEYYNSTNYSRKFINDNTDKYNHIEKNLEYLQLYASSDDFHKYLDENSDLKYKYDFNRSVIDDNQRILNEKSYTYFLNICSIQNRTLSKLVSAIIENYKQTNNLQKNMSFDSNFNLHFIKSDNGWILD